MTRAQAWLVGALIALCSIVALAVARLPSSSSAQSLPAGSAEPQPLRGVTLRGETGLRLLVADQPPFVLDLDSASVTPLAGFGSMTPGRPNVIFPVAGRVGIVVSGASDHTLYAVRGRPLSVTPLGSGTTATATSDGQAVWVQQRLGDSVRSPCTLREVGLDGGLLRAPRSFPCPSYARGGALGLVVGRGRRVVDPASGRTVFTTQGRILASAGSKVVVVGPGEQQLTLRDPATKAKRRLRWPSSVWRLDDPAVDPSGRFVALAWANLSWHGGGQQVLDLWLLDTKTARLSHVPGMPAFVRLKRTNMAWTDDGRLVLLVRTGNGNEVVAVWRPGQAHLALKFVQLPDRSNNGSDSIALLR